MSDYKVMWSYFNLQGMSGSPWGSNLTSVVSFAQEKGILTNINGGSLVFQCSAVGRATSSDTYKITRPGVSICSGYLANVGFNTMDGVEIVSYPNQTGRAETGYCLQVFDQSAYNFLDNSSIDILQPPVSSTLSTFEIRVPLKYVFDFASIENRFLSIRDIHFTLTFENLFNMFSPPSTGVQTGFGINILNVSLLVPQYKIENEKMLSPEIFLPPVHRIWCNTFNISATATDFNNTLNVAGKIKKFFYAFIQKTGATVNSSGQSTVDGVFTLNPNLSTIPKFVQLQVGSKLFPTYTSYNSVLSATDKQNVIRHFQEFQTIAKNWTNDKNSIVTSSNWETTYRIYAIDIAGVDAQTNITFTLQWGVPFGVACNLLTFAIYDL